MERSAGPASAGVAALPTCHNLGKLLAETERPDEAIALLRRAVGIFETRLADENPWAVAARKSRAKATAARD